MTESSIDKDLYQMAYDMRRVNASERTIEMKGQGSYTSTAPGSRIVEELSRRFLVALRAYCKKKTKRTKGGASTTRRAQEIFDTLDKGVVTAITVQTLVDSLCSDRKMTISATRNAVGSALQRQVDLSSYFKANPRMFRILETAIKAALRRNRGRAQSLLDSIKKTAPEQFEPSSLVRDDFMLAGSAALELILDCCSDVFETEQVMDYERPTRRKVRSYVRFTRDFMSRMADLEDLFAAVTPMNIPISDRPLDWTTPTDGGFYHNMLNRRALMSCKDKVQLQALKESDCADVYQCVNTLQSVKWVINEEVRLVAEEAIHTGWDDGNLDLPVTEGPTDPEYPGDHVRQENGREWQLYCQHKREYHRTVESWDKLRSRHARVLYFARTYSERGEPFHFVHGIDFRGRLYPMTAALSYQADDLNRSLCKFAEAKPLQTQEQADWYLIHGANCFGYDKVTLKERVKWVYANADKIRAVADDPIENRWWTEADKPWCFLAWALEAGEFLRNPKPGFMSSLPVAVDGSNNGLQIYSLMLRQEGPARATNCVPCDQPNDIYQDVADKATELLKRIASDASEDERRQAWAKDWLNFCNGRLPRASCKRSVMTTPYGCTDYSKQHYVTEWMHSVVKGKSFESTPFTEGRTYGATTFLAELITTALADVVSAASEAMTWLREVAKIASDHGVHLRWTAPSGLKVQQRYAKSKSRLVQLHCRRAIKIWLRDQTDAVDSSKSANGLCPNYVHSLDAAAAALTVNRAALEGVTGFQFIHDSFGCHAADMPTLSRVLREVYCDIFSDDLLGKFRQEAYTQLPSGVELPEPPHLGSLKVSGLLQSKYFFA